MSKPIKLDEFWRHGYIVYGGEGNQVFIFNLSELKDLIDNLPKMGWSTPSLQQCLDAKKTCVCGTLDEETLTKCHSVWSIVRG